jgi:hypothetical protein
MDYKRCMDLVSNLCGYNSSSHRIQVSIMADGSKMTQQQDWTNCMSCKHEVHGPNDEPDIIVCSHHITEEEIINWLEYLRCKGYEIEDAIRFLKSKEISTHGIVTFMPY